MNLSVRIAASLITVAVLAGSVVSVLGQGVPNGVKNRASELEARSAIEPQAFVGSDGRQHLVYDLLITSKSKDEQRVTGIEVLDADRQVTVLSGARLRGLLDNPAGLVSASVSLRAFIWVSFDAGARVPAVLRHQLATDAGVSVAWPVHVSQTRPVALGPPLKGLWLAYDGPSESGRHRRNPATRFATDWNKTTEKGGFFAGALDKRESYFSYGAEVLAVADAIVDSAINDVADSPVDIDRPSGGTPGNLIRLNLGDNQFAVYAHLQQGSVRVEPGARVRRGDVIGLVGNSGDSNAPHLHFHVVRRTPDQTPEGIPYFFESFEVQQPDRFAPKRNALPLSDDVVRFVLD